MTEYEGCYRKSLILLSLRLLLKRFKSVRALYLSIAQFGRQESKKFSYPQLSRYLRGEVSIPLEKEVFFLDFLKSELNIERDLILPYIEVDQTLIPLLIDLNGILSYPERINLLVFHTLERKLVPNDKFDAILTHPEAVPIAIAFSTVMRIPWRSISFRPPNQPPSRFRSYPYFIDNELISQVYFTSRKKGIQGKKLLLVSDYIRRGGFIDLLLQITEEKEAHIHFFYAILGIGTDWRRLARSLDGNLAVGHSIN
ncbi:MAG: hypothetical protein ACFFE8_01740 [Candidatus Heimdallarchaeota archaeon]